MKRKFSVNRFYVLVRAVVVVISSISAFISIYFIVNMASIQSSLLTTMDTTCAIFEEVRQVTYCKMPFFEAIEQNYFVMYVSILLALVLPTMFFGIVSVYKYLFTEVKIR